MGTKVLLFLHIRKKKFEIPSKTILSSYFFMVNLQYNFKKERLDNSHQYGHTEHSTQLDNRILQICAQLFLE